MAKTSRTTYVIAGSFVLIIVGLGFRGTRRVVASVWQKQSDECAQVHAEEACLHDAECGWCEDPVPNTQHSGRCSKWCTGLAVGSSALYYMDGDAYQCPPSKLVRNSTEPVPNMLQCSSAEQNAYQIASLAIVLFSGTLLFAAGARWLYLQHKLLLRPSRAGGMLRLMFPDMLFLGHARPPLPVHVFLLMLGALMSPPTCAVLLALSYMDLTLPRKSATVSLYTSVRGGSALLLGIATLELTKLILHVPHTDRRAYARLCCARLFAFVCVALQWPDPPLIGEDTEWVHTVEPMLANVLVTVAVSLEVALEGTALLKLLLAIYAALTALSMMLVGAGWTHSMHHELQAQWLTWIHGVMVVARGFAAGFDVALHDAHEHGDAAPHAPHAPPAPQESRGGAAKVADARDVGRLDSPLLDVSP